MSPFRLAPGAAAGLRGAAAGSIALAMVACGGGGLSPLPPASSPGTAPSPVPAAAAAGFRYAAGDGQVVVESRAIIEVTTDTATRRDTSATSVWISYRIGGGSGARPVEVSVDSVHGHSGALVPPTPLLARPIRYDGRLEGGRVLLPLDEGRAADCASPAGALHGAARDVLPTLPTRLTPGTRWEESTTSTSCRGGVLLTVAARHQYSVPGDDPLTPEGHIRLRRTTELRVSGSGSQAGELVSATGHGSGAAELLVNQVAGRFLGGVARSRLELMFTGAGREQRVVQDSEQQIRSITPH